MASTRVRMTIEWQIPIGQTRAINEALHSVAADVRTTRGCAGCSVSTDLSNRGTVRYTEEWLTEADLRQRLRSDTFAHLIALMDDAMLPPRLEFTLPHETRGFDFLEEVRASVP